MAWLPLTSTTVEPARLDMERCASGGIILSSVAIRYQLGLAFHAGPLIFDKRGHGLALVRSKGGDIHEPYNLGIVSGFGDHRSSIRVADENCRPVLRCKNAPGNRHVVL